MAEPKFADLLTLFKDQHVANHSSMSDAALLAMSASKKKKTAAIGPRHLGRARQVGGAGPTGRQTSEEAGCRGHSDGGNGYHSEGDEGHGKGSCVDRVGTIAGTYRGSCIDCGGIDRGIGIFGTDRGSCIDCGGIDRGGTIADAIAGTDRGACIERGGIGPGSIIDGRGSCIDCGGTFIIGPYCRKVRTHAVSGSIVRGQCSVYTLEATWT
jgi:hypothetical protein